MSNNQPGMHEPYGTFGASYGTPPGVGESPMRSLRGEDKKESKRGKKRKEKAAPQSNSTKRLLNKQRVFALGFAALAGLLALSLTSTTEETTFVVRTTAVVPALSNLTAAQVEAVALPTVAIEEGAITATTAEGAIEKISTLLETGRLRTSLRKGHQLHLDDFTADVELAAPLGPDERIFALEAGVVAAVGGQLRSGDRVDVVAVIEFEGKVLSNVIATDIEILSALPGEQQFNAVAQEQVNGSRDSAGADLLPSDPVPGIYNVRVSVSQAVTLSAAASRGELVLVLRGKDAQNTPTAPVRLDEVVANSSGAAAPQPSPTVPAGGQ